MNSLVIEPIFGSRWIVLAIAAITGVLLVWLRPTGREISTNQQRRLIGLRMGALLMLLLALLRPAWVHTDARPAAATLAVMVDHSRSMTLPSGRDGTRWKEERESAARLASGLSDLDERLDVQFYRYGSDAQRVASDQIDSFLQQPPSENRTDLAAALRAALTGAGGQPLAAVILMGDGTSTVQDSNPGVVARTLQSLDVPLWTVPIGPAAPSDESRDLAVDQLAEQFRVFSKNQFQVTASIRARGVVGRNLPVTLSLIDSQGARQELARRQVVAVTAEESIPLDLQINAPEPGTYRLEVRAEPQPGETLTDNNTQIAFLDVREGGGRVLYLEGELRYEQRFLRQSINESPDLSLVYRWIDGRSRASWPVDLEEDLQPGQFNAYIIGDLEAAALGEENLRKLAEAVKRGSGLLMIGGLHTFDVGGYAGSPLADVLPIELDASRRTPSDQEPPSGAMIDGPVLIRLGRPHPITQLTSTGNNLELWQNLKPLLGANRFVGAKVNPTVETLLETDGDQPLLVVGQSGSGRVVAFAGDTTWQWWMQGRSDAHRRFWRQLLLWLLARDAPDSDSVWVELETRRLNRGDPVRFAAGVQSLDPQQSETPLQATIIDAEGEAIELQTEPATNSAPSGRDDALVAGTLPDLAGGLYTLRIAAADSESSLQPAELQFQVVDLDLELSRPNAEISRMQQLAAITANSGGRAYAPEEISQLIEDARELRQRAELPVVEKNRLGDDPLTGWILMLGMTGLLTAEWYCRRSWGLA